MILGVPGVMRDACNMGARDLPDMYALGPAALRLWAYILGKSLVPMLQLLQIPWICSIFHLVATLLTGCKQLTYNNLKIINVFI